MAENDQTDDVSGAPLTDQYPSYPEWPSNRGLPTDEIEVALELPDRPDYEKWENREMDTMLAAALETARETEADYLTNLLLIELAAYRESGGHQS